MIPIFSVALILDKDENVINNDKHVLRHSSKCSDKLYGNIVLKDANWNEHFKNFLGSQYINWKLALRLFDSIFDQTY